MKRKIIGIVLSFLMVFSTCSGAVVAAEDEIGMYTGMRLLIL